MTAHGAWAFGRGKCYLLDMGVVLGVVATVGVGAELVEFGAGTGCYARALSHCKVNVLAAYDGVEGIEQISGGVVRRADLSQPLHAPAEWTFSLETGEHIPDSFAATFLDNIALNARVGMVLSWAVPGQPGVGHVNGRSAKWVAHQMAMRNFTLNQTQTAAVKRSANLWFFNRNLQVFRRSRVAMPRSGEVSRTPLMKPKALGSPEQHVVAQP